ncbi:chloride channel protein [Methylocapsa aurea]|uniref:chloride channel protein n=1 Tax=Methylocapsa aurea TaxID=663610 RepID=UPI000A0523D6|nr:chloride channel protein [Methylocapsa aurea]
MVDPERANARIHFIFQIPSQLFAHLRAQVRALVRRDEIGLIGLGLLAGATSGLFVSGILAGSSFLHEWLFGQARVSSLAALGSPAQALAPLAGGLLLGFCGIFIRRWRPRRPVDPIEANALHGGRMSLRDSAIITAQTVISNGFGASVGLEAAYTQMGSGFASWLGRVFALRRNDMRTLVACGSAGAIGAAFGAPVTGAFYAFELILGTYTPFGLAPVGAAAIGGVLVARLLGSSGAFMGEVVAPSALSETEMALLLLLGVFCAAFGIAIMGAVRYVEAFFRWTRLPQAIQPALGGLAVGAMALVTPQVLGSGHGALFELFFGAGRPAIDLIVLALALKAIASVISIGSGFRGGLFFASLFLGAMMGEAYAAAIGALYPVIAPNAWVCAIVGMTALGVAIVGGPLTMSFLALETTGDFPLSLAMLSVSTVVSVIVRRLFGYSFATWRLHLRGESIRSAHDIGWMRDLTVGRMMRTDVATAPSWMTIAEFVERFPPGSAQWVAATDSSGRYEGMISLPDAHLVNLNAESSGARISALSRDPEGFLLAQMNIKLAAQLFEQSESEAFAVVDNEADRRVIGLLTEAHVLRRYAEELDKARRDLAGEIWTANS